MINNSCFYHLGRITLPTGDLSIHPDIGVASHPQHLRLRPVWQDPLHIM